MSYSHSSHRQDIIGQEGYDVWYFILPMYAFFTSCFIKYTIVKKPFLFLNVYNQFIFIKLNNAHKNISSIPTATTSLVIVNTVIFVFGLL
jgi:hypothetical protein